MDEDNIGADLLASFNELSKEDDQVVDGTGLVTEVPGSAGAQTVPGAAAADGGDGLSEVKQPPASTAQPGQVGQEGKVAGAAAPGATGQPQNTPPARAPTSWKPLLREKWSTIDPEVQGEILRREQEIHQGLRASADARRHYDEFNRLAQPYAHFFQAENSTPMQGFNNYMQTAALLRVGTPQQKASVLGQLVTQFGIDVELLDQAIATGLKNAPATAAQPNQLPPHLEHLINQRMQPVQAMLQTMQERAAQANQQSEQSIQSEIEAFATDPANEFFEDVRMEVADMLEVAARNGRVLSLQDAYKRATLTHPQIAEVIASRQARQGAQKRTQAAARALEASVSLPSSGAPDGTGDDNDQLGDSLRADIIRAARAQQR